MRWQPGDVVVWREAWRGREYIAVPVRVVEDSDDVLAVYVCAGTRYAFPEPWPFAEQHPWAERGRFEGEGILIAHSPGAAHSIWHFWTGQQRTFAAWYVNMQEPFRREGDSYWTQDHELDLIARPDGTWSWKDEQELLDWVPRGRFTEADVEAIRAEGERVLAERPFPTGWEDWQPDPTWPVPELPRA